MEKNLNKEIEYVGIDMENRWNSYVYLKSNDEITQFANEYFARRDSRVLFVMGCGFDPRMNNVLSQIASQKVFKKILCLLIEFPSNEKSPQDILYAENKSDFEDLCRQFGVSVKIICDDHPRDIEKRIVSISRQLRAINCDEYSDIIIDVSALPRALYFNVCNFFYKQCEDNCTNLFFSVSENVEIDNNIYNIAGDEIHPIHGFGLNYMLESNLDKRSVLIPLLGENHEQELAKIYDNFKPVDVCPVLPFPSVNPRRSEDILITYMEFFKRIEIDEPQNYTYADERNPFELYSIISDLIKNYKKTLAPITQCVCFGIATLTSKLLSLGALLTGLENSKEISFYTSSPVSYQVKNLETLKTLNKNSQSYMMWITGEAYADK